MSVAHQKNRNKSAIRARSGANRTGKMSCRTVGNVYTPIVNSAVFRLLVQHRPKLRCAPTLKPSMLITARSELSKYDATVDFSPAQCGEYLVDVFKSVAMDVRADFSFSGEVQRFL